MKKRDLAVNDDQQRLHDLKNMSPPLESGGCHWALDLSSMKVTYSEKMLGLLSTSLPESVLDSLELLYSSSLPEDAALIRSTLHRSIEHRKGFNIAHRINDSQGQVKSVVTNAQYVITGDGTPGLFALTTDAADLVHQETVVPASDKELETFIYKAYHDLRGPIASILGLVSLTEGERDVRQVKAYVGKIGDIANKQNRMLITLVKTMSIRETEPNYQRVLMVELFAETIAQLGDLPNFRRVRLRVRNQATDYLLCDATILKDMLLQILENAINYADLSKPNPEVSVIAYIRESDLRIEVQDNGIGMTEEIRGRIFDLFYRGSHLSKGSGLGLYFVKNAVEKLHGSIKVRSVENQGSVFDICVPIPTE